MEPANQGAKKAMPVTDDNDTIHGTDLFIQHAGDNRGLPNVEGKAYARIARKLLGRLPDQQIKAKS